MPLICVPPLLSLGITYSLTFVHPVLPVVRESITAILSSLRAMLQQYWMYTPILGRTSKGAQPAADPVWLQSLILGGYDPSKHPAPPMISSRFEWETAQNKLIFAFGEASARTSNDCTITTNHHPPGSSIRKSLVSSFRPDDFSPPRPISPATTASRASSERQSSSAPSDP